MKRGSVYWINLEPASPPEFGKLRPGIIISNTEQNLRLQTVVMIPLSSQPPEIWPLRIKAGTKGMKESFAVIPGVRQISKARLHENIGFLNSEQLSNLEEALGAYLKD